jgi:IclR family acetate operon transcriptional repressor
MSTNDSSENGHRTASRVLDILEDLAESPQGRALRDLSSDLKAPKSSLLPLLRTLVNRNYITHDDAGIYRLGSKLIELGMGSIAELDVREIAHPALVDLSKRTGEAVMLATLASDSLAIMYVDKVESIHRIRYAAGVGERRPLHSTSSGKVLLAFMPMAQRNAVIKAIKLIRYTDETVSTKAELRAELETVRKEGVCVNIDQAVVGRCAIAAPIFDHHGNAVAACVLGAPKERIKNNLSGLISEVKATALAISKLLGHRMIQRTSE